ncbi:hypothetical protein IW146_004133 [Coemansia sp. RSA 922]|nr:hypothetical protein H4S04_002908 [Coemansia sp. S16]KAJ2060098.1 hypothetical protein GGI08_003106 [Coemansia sp. S2]KAJ2113077.1 hypothetical protein IW146_004133 [Coemansia sp. RSA 922]KAJ2348764.1 hypothetical protein GGH92_002726 [Coemansia sp. RSA 2673]
MGPEMCVFLATPQLSLQIDGQALPQEHYFKYLGLMIGVKGIAPKKHIELLCAHVQAKLGYMRSVGITHLNGNLNWVIGMYKAFIRPTMEYVLEICIPNASLIKVMECCQEDMLHVMLRVPKSTSYVAILLLCKMVTMEYCWHGTISTFAVLIIRVDSWLAENSHQIPRLCQEAYFASPPHRIIMTIGE